MLDRPQTRVAEGGPSWGHAGGVPARCARPRPPRNTSSARDSSAIAPYCERHLSACMCARCNRALAPGGSMWRHRTAASVRGNNVSTMERAGPPHRGSRLDLTRSDRCADPQTAVQNRVAALRLAGYGARPSISRDQVLDDRIRPRRSDGFVDDDLRCAEMRPRSSSSHCGRSRQELSPEPAAAANRVVGCDAHPHQKSQLCRTSPVAFLSRRSVRVDRADLTER
jgi:hypothetical protein